MTPEPTPTHKVSAFPYQIRGLIRCQRRALRASVGAMARHLHLAPARPASDCTDGTPTAVRVVVAEDHAFMRRSLRLLLEHDRGLSLVAEAPDLKSAVAHVLAGQPDVLVLDLGMPDGSSLHAISDLRRRAPGTQIVALSMNDDPAFARGALAAGALGFVLKQLADEELPRAVYTVARRSRYVSPRVAARLDAARGPRNRRAPVDRRNDSWAVPRTRPVRDPSSPRCSRRPNVPVARPSPASPSLRS